MKKLIEKRYEYTPGGRIIIDVTVDNIFEIYNNFDKKASFSKKELDQDFVDYIVESAGEIKDNRFLIRISPEQPVQDADRERVIQSVKNYFRYLKEVEVLKFTRNIKKILFLLLLGITLIGISISGWINKLITSHPSLRILEEGIIIAAWVSLWQVFALIFIEWHPYVQKIKLYNKLLRSEVIISHHSEK
jgi:hypothetical protein